MLPLLKMLKRKTGGALKNVNLAYIQPASLARGRGQSFRSLGSAKVNVGKKNLFGEIKNYNSGASKQNKLAHNSNNLMPPGFDRMEEDIPFTQEAEMMQVGATSKNVRDTCSQPGALARGRGQSFRSLGSTKGNVGKKNLFGEIKNYNSGASKQNKLAHNSNNLMPPGFDMMEEDIPFTQEAEMMQETIATSKNVQDTYSQPGALARVRGQNVRSVVSVKGSVGKRNLVRESKNHNSAASEQNKLAHNSNNLMPPSFDPMEDDVSLAQEDEMMQDLCESENPKKVRGKNRNKDVAGLKPGETFRVHFYHNRVVGKHQASFSRHLGILVRDCNICPLQVHSWKDIRKDKLEHMWRAVTDKFDSDDMNHQRDHVLNHMRKLQNNWRGSLHKYVKFKSLHEALKDVPDEVDKSD
uniref:Uncharacterized protein isoform X1 n=2 Tax=Nicotiana TaxID=4085 RepID=A0A1S3YRD9_TOBAC|nr:PREDICTED: uncharacterized protein LOC107778740 isoform X1 [Nicotiana tabacum]